ncbi:hypothetical protein FQN54_001856 [Arachnomyces sp. PD_36]|nr:hypothetical protein FQN54_001856 [Arachnomyces sp. PD_36]
MMTESTPSSLIEADDNNSDGDSAFEGSVGSASYQTSINSSIRNYKYENGRRYHAFREGAYALPNDEEEQDRMDLLHHVYGMLLDGELTTAPIGKDIKRVLDLGTGTGIWAVDFASAFPAAEIIGNDLSPIQPGWVPPNLQFEIDDFEAEWPYSRPFDYIHGRELAGSVADFDRLFKQAFNALKPGGYLEMQSFLIQIFTDDNTLDKAVHTVPWVNHLQEASVKFGKPMANVPEWEDKMISAGFEDVTCKIVKVPMSPWPKDRKLKDIGRYMQVEQLQAMPAYTRALLSRILNWGSEEIEVLLAHVSAELKDRSIHQYAKVYFLYGRKPL